jgi:hypothetical protein
MALVKRSSLLRVRPSVLRCAFQKQNGQLCTLISSREPEGSAARISFAPGLPSQMTPPTGVLSWPERDADTNTVLIGRNQKAFQL